jgi:uncharacterized hydrophobic protein (TIGR00271 family)
MTSRVAGLQNRLASLLGLEPARRTPLVRGMLHRPSGDAAGYWLQLFIAAALATLGLALNSTAVVIGAMLIAPLMRPIVELAMGLATGSAPLVFRTGIRAIASIAVVIASSAAFTLLLPFHEVTPELLARTAPSILDLFVAAACALAGAYAIVIAGNDVATTAAGTSIGISLVPPLCTAGYGISTADWDMAAGAGLLFTANITGIITVAGAVFVLVGFGQVDIREEERSLDSDVEIGAATRLGRVVSRRSARLGVVSRVLLPVLLVGAIAYPLVEAVGEMSRRSSIRQHVASVLRRNGDDRLVQYTLDQATRPLALRVVIVGDPVEGQALEALLRRELAARGEPDAAVAVWSVSDATAVSALTARLEDLPSRLRPPPPPPAPPPPPLPLDARVRAAWPTEHGGELISLWISEGPPLEIRLAHLGPELGPAGREVLARAVAVDTVPTIHETALPALGMVEGVEGAMDEMSALLAHAGEYRDVHFCVHAPPPPRRRMPAAEKQLRDLVAAAARRDANVTVLDGDAWRIVPQRAPCTPPPGG